MRAPEYRVKTRLGRGATAALGAALGAAGFAFGCSSDEAPVPLYGAACNPPSCTFPTGGDTGAGGMSSAGTGGGAEVGGTGGGAEVGGAAGAGTPDEGGAAGGEPR